METYDFINEIHESQEVLNEAERILNEILGLDKSADDEFWWNNIDESQVVKSNSGCYSISMSVPSTEI